MNILSGYGSSGDEDDGDNKQTESSYDSIKPIQQKQEVNFVKKIASSLTSAVGKDNNSNTFPKKRKAVIFSTLPIEIQNALARGSTSLDSDSDDDVSNAAVKSLKSNSFNGGGLMSVLPAPKNSLLDSSKGTNSSSSRSLSELQRPNSNIRSVPSIIANSSISNNLYDNVNDDHGADRPSPSHGIHMESGGSLFTLNSGVLNRQQSAETISIDSDVSFKFNRNPTMPSALNSGSFDAGANGQISMNSLPDFSESYRGIGGGTLSTSAPLAAFSSNEVLSVNRNSDFSSHSSSSTAEESESTYDYGNINSSIGRKKRDRDIEQQLISGNLDAAQTMGGGVREMRASSDWNAQAYTMQKQNEAELHRAFFAAKGGEKAIAPVSKLQGRKHQINSLVLQAAKTELSLLNAKGDRNLSKQETRTKYGW